MAEPTAHTEVPGGHPAFPPFQAQYLPSQLLWLAVSFVLLYVLMSRVALAADRFDYGRPQQAHRRRPHGGRRIRRQSDAANAAYEKALADARAAPSRSPARRASNRRRGRGDQKRLEAELNARLASAEQSIATTRTAAMGNVGAIAADTASAIVERLIGRRPPSMKSPPPWATCSSAEDRQCLKPCRN